MDNSASSSNGGDLLSLLLKKPPPHQIERSRTPPVQPTVTKEEATRPLTPPANLPRRRPNSREGILKRNNQGKERSLLPSGEQEHKNVNELGKSVNELGMEVVSAESQQAPVAARWRLQRVSDEQRAPQNKPRGPDGTKGFAAGRGKALTADVGRSILGEPPKESAGSRPQSSEGGRETPQNGNGNQQKTPQNGNGDQQKNLDLQLKIAQFLVAQEMKTGSKKEDSSQGGPSENGSSADEEAPFAPPPSRQGSRKGRESPVSGEKLDIAQPSIDELSPTIVPTKKEEQQVDVERLTKLLESAFASQSGGASFVARAADEWLETDLASARDKVSAVLEKSIGTPAYADLVDLEKHLKATMAELRRFRSFVKSEQGSQKRTSEMEKLEGSVRMLRYELGAAQAEAGRLEAELAFERTERGSKAGANEGGGQLERMRLELRAWQGEVENLKSALEKSEESRQAALMQMQSKEADFFQLQQEKEVLRASAHTAETALKDALENERAGWKAQLDAAHAEVEQLRLRRASELEGIERLRSNAEEIERQIAAARMGAAHFDHHTSGDLQQRYNGEAQDVLSQLFPKSSASSAMTWQQQDLTRQQEAQYAADQPGSGQLTWQQQEMTRQQVPHQNQRGGHFGGHMRPPVLHETDLAFAHQQRQLAQHRQFQGGHFQGQPPPPSAAPVQRYPAPVWDDLAVTRGSASRDPRYHQAQQPHPGQQRIGPFPAATPQAFWQQPFSRDQPTPSLARTASAVEQEMLGRSRSSDFAMPIPVSVLLAAGRNAPKQGHRMAVQPATSASLGLVEDDEILFKGR